jgi:hypothetical protein
MDPYLEDPAFWPDFHHWFLTCWCESLLRILPAAYDVRFNERVNLVQLDANTIKVVYPDLAILEQTRSKGQPIHHEGTLLLEPVTLPHVALEEVRETFIEIHHRRDRTLVTVLELLSPANKHGNGAFEYGLKRIEILRQRVHLVEVDLLIGGERVSMAKPLPAGVYYSFVTRASNRSLCDVYATTLKQPLPTIPIPLLPRDDEPSVDLQKVFESAFERGRYADVLDYGKEPKAKLSKRDAVWLKQRLAKRPANGKSHT